MGLFELLLNFRRISHYIRTCKEDIKAFAPDVVILIDYGGFNRRIAKHCKRNGIKVFYYIPPKVWAWYQSRAWELKRNVDKMFVILPFEKDFYKTKVDWEVDYVGNPVLDAVKDFTIDKNFLEKNTFHSSKQLVALLPGSRKQELKLIIPVMANVVASNQHIHFAVATVSNLDKDLYNPFLSFSNVSFVEEATYDLLHHAQAAIVTSGTATLETALFNVPQVVVYKTSAINYFIGKRLVKVPFISLVNLIGNKDVVKELLQEKCTPEIISNEIDKLLNDKAYRSKVIEGNKQVYETLDIGSASKNTARLMQKYLSFKTPLSSGEG